MPRNSELLIFWKEVLSKLLLTNANLSEEVLSHWIGHITMLYMLHAQIESGWTLCLVAEWYHLARKQYRTRLARSSARKHAQYYRFIAIQFELAYFCRFFICIQYCIRMSSTLWYLYFACFVCFVCWLKSYHSIHLFRLNANEWRCTVEWDWTKASTMRDRWRQKTEKRQKLDSQQNRLMNNFSRLESLVIMLNVAHKLFGKLKKNRARKKSIDDILWLAKLHLNTYCLRNVVFFFALLKELIVFVLRDVKNSNGQTSRRGKEKGRERERRNNQTN